MNDRTKRVYYKVPRYKKADRITKRILSCKENFGRHIFRLKALHKIYEEIAKEALHGQNLLPFDGFIFKKDGLNIYLDTYNSEYEAFCKKINRYKTFRGEQMTVIQAEIEGTQNLPIKERLKVHIEFLRLFHKGFKVRKAVRIAKRKTKTIL